MTTAWFEESFGEDYLIVYKHRDISGAQAEVRNMIRWLELPPGAAVFDLCCGMGRHALALAEAGYRVTGADLSDVLLREARRLDVEQRVTWLKSDMRELPPIGPFDAVVNLFTSFGYFDAEDDHIRVLRGMARLLADDGKFIIDYLNPGAVIRGLVPRSQRQDGPLTIIETRAIEDGFVRKRIVVSEPGREDRHYKEQVRLFGLEQFRSMAAAGGLTIEQVYGGYDGSAYDPEHSGRLIMVGKKKGSVQGGER
ncbi:SAM-dependent methyltransferase [Paenibacillus cymbidii]|uniref:SAM-dependent methyltransferase n=1 Tax=Paenibacillus cymbidii TaxID=1639034 RepID=UPI001081F8AB|nr:class I SAM-dependent methyltransferase [Paenibacillus cymbidii]